MARETVLEQTLGREICMMKRLGDYIRPVDVRNRDLKVTRLMGLSMTKEFRPTTSNIVGTDLSIYRVVNKWQFACDFMSPIRVNKLPVVLKMDDEPIIVSPAYPVFEVIDKNALDPEYLMMWFRRPEFDRYVVFKCDGAVRGGYSWSDLCDTPMPIPAIEKQREIVAEYNTLATRIETNKKLIATLEQTAQTLYRHTFVDNIDPNNLPEGWRMGTLGELISVKYGKDHKNIAPGNIPIWGSGGIMRFGNQALFDKESVLVPRKGSIGNIVYIDEPFWTVDTMFYTVMRYPSVAKFVYFFLLSQNIESLAVGSAVPSMTAEIIENLVVACPTQKILNNFDLQMIPLFKEIKNRKREESVLQQMQTLLLSKMGA